jgi:endonuclease III
MVVPKAVACSEMSRRRRTAWTVRRIHALSSTLKQVYGNPRHHNKDDPLDELVFIILSSKTNERGYLETYNELRRAFPAWQGILDADQGDVTRHIHAGGLAAKKERWLRDLLQSLKSKTGALDLTFLSAMDTADAEDFLTSLPGVGLKTARCVLMYSIGRDVFPVDSHCRRILSRLGIIEFGRLTDRVQDEIQLKIPPELRYSLHVNLVAHGRAVCRARNPDCNHCSVSPKCQYHMLHLDTC